MSILPKFLYLFQSIPLNMPASFFSFLNKIFTKFIWNNKRPRLRLSLLYLPYDRGGLRLPNLKLYYWAAQLWAATCYFSTTDTPAWIHIENKTKLPIISYLYSDETKQLLKDTKNPFLKNTLSVWHQSHIALSEAPTISYLSPIWGNNRFKPGRADMGFKIRFNKGLKKIGEILDILTTFKMFTLAEILFFTVRYFGLKQLQYSSL
uniref:Reverse transcriptase domain-containing protein n=1 Tax=Pygocentrus nattereri TaxID=42514 RepID=A0AAR2JXT8_PYGNA